MRRFCSTSEATALVARASLPPSFSTSEPAALVLIEHAVEPAATVDQSSRNLPLGVTFKKMLPCCSFHGIGQHHNNSFMQCRSPPVSLDACGWSWKHLYSWRSHRERAMASSGDRERSRGPQRKRFKPIPLAVTRCTCPCGFPGEMIDVEVPPDLPMVPCRCTGCGPTAYVGCATRIAPYMEVCGPCRLFLEIDSTPQSHSAGDAGGCPGQCCVKLGRRQPVAGQLFIACWDSL